MGDTSWQELFRIEQELALCREGSCCGPAQIYKETASTLREARPDPKFPERAPRELGHLRCFKFRASQCNP